MICMIREAQQIFSTEYPWRGTFVRTCPNWHSEITESRAPRHRVFALTLQTASSFPHQTRNQPIQHHLHIHGSNPAHQQESICGTTHLIRPRLFAQIFLTISSQCPRQLPEFWPRIFSNSSIRLCACWAKSRNYVVILAF